MNAETPALQAENHALRQEVATLREQNAALQAQLTAALARIAHLETRPPDPPAFVKATTPTGTTICRGRISAAGCICCATCTS